MTRFRLAVAVALVALGAPTAASAATGSPAWPYHVVSATGSVAWQYAGPSGRGLDAVTFQGRIRRANGMLHGRATYTDQNSQGCGPVRHTRTKNFPRPTFSVQGAYVVVSWNVPLPNDSYCNGATSSSIANQVPAWGVFSERLPLSRFACFADSLKLGGQETISQAGTTGTLVYQGTVILARPPGPITVSL